MRSAIPTPSKTPWLRAWRVIFWVQIVVVTALMLWPRPPAAVDLTGWDKLNHAIAFAGPALAGLLARRRRGLWSALALLGALLAWGGALELLQTQLPPRQGDWGDLLADAVGLVCGAGLYGLLRRWIIRLG